MTLLRVATLALFAGRAGWGQGPIAPRLVKPLMAAPGAPVVTILPAVNGAMVRSLGGGNATVDVGKVTYYAKYSAPGQTRTKKSRSVVVSTRFALKIDCPGSSPSSKLNITMSRTDAEPSHSISIDGTEVGLAARTLMRSLPCGSRVEHLMDIEVPVSTPAGSIASNVLFQATLEK